MNIKLKIIFVIVITLALGIVMGAMLNRALTQNRIRSILSRRNPVRFVASFEKFIEPSADQRKLVRDILNKHAKRISEIRAKSREELQSSLESMMAELDPILAPEQKKRLEKRRLPGRFLFRNRRLEIIDVDEEIFVLKERLSLSENQASQIKHILEDSRNQVKMIREKRVNFRKRLQIMKEMEEKKEKAIEKILTKDQKKLYEQIKKRRHKKIEEMRKRREIMNEQGFPRF